MNDYEWRKRIINYIMPQLNLELSRRILRIPNNEFLTMNEITRNQ